MTTFRCIHCGHPFEADDAANASAVRCVQCGEMLLSARRSSAPNTEIGTTPILESNTESRSAGEEAEAVKPAPDQFAEKDTVVPKAKDAVNPTFSFLAPALAPGELGWLAHYRVVRLLGQGGMGIVFQAIDTELQRPVALKVMRPELAHDDVARQRFLREARAMAAVNSDYVVTVHHVGVHLGIPYLSTEFLVGEPLDLWLQSRDRLQTDEILRLGIEIARGLMAAHERGLIHRDIKPGNIFLERIGNGSRDAESAPAYRVKILDFGLARITRERSPLTNPGLVMGTPAYMAPEQVEGKAVDARCDLFSIGCLLYEMATGETPFKGDSAVAILMAVATKHPRPPRELNPNVPPPLAKLILKLLAKNPKDRPASALEVVETLETIAQKLGISTITPTSGSSQIGDWNKAVLTVRSRRWLPIGIALACGLLLGGLLVWQGVAYWGSRRPAYAGSPQRAVQGVTDSEIVLGMIGPFSGSARELGREMNMGINTCFAHINEQGGVAGRKLKLIELDDAHDPDRALADLRELDQDHQIFGTIGNVGSAAAMKTLPYSLDKHLLFFAPLAGSNLLRKDPPDRYVFNYRASTEEELAALVKYLLEVRKVPGDQIAVFTENDTFGTESYRNVVRMVHRYDSQKEVLHLGYERNTLRIDDAAKAILQHRDLRAIVLIAPYKPAAALIVKVKDVRSDLIFASVSSVGSKALAETLHERGPQYAKDVIVTQVVPPIDSSATLVLKYREQLRKHHPSEQPTYTSLEGYIAAAILVEGLKRTGEDLTTETLIDALESLRDFDLGTGAPIRFGPSEHQASHKVWGTILDQDGRYQALPLHE